MKQRKQERKKIITIILLITITIASIGIINDAEAIKQEPYQKEKNNVAEIKAYDCNLNDCDEIIENNLREAKKITCAFYTLHNKEISKILLEKKAKVILDEESIKTKTDEKNNKFPIRKGLGRMHNKFCILNDEKVITGSHNPSEHLNDTDDNILLITSKNIAERYQDIFDMIQKKKARRSNTQTADEQQTLIAYACPQDHCEEKVLKEINKAQEEIDFAFFTFTGQKISDALIKKARTGVNIEGIIESYQQRATNQFFTLKDAGLQQVIEETSPRTQHNKIIIIDHNTTITGSYNPTYSADRRNDENLIIIHNKQIARFYEALIKRIMTRENKQQKGKLQEHQEK